MEATWFQSTGTIEYGPGIRVVVAVERGIVEFYRALIPKSITVKPQKYGAHVSVVRVWEKPTKMEVWEKHNGLKVQFEYEPVVHNDDKYYWLNVRCSKIEEIREELGLTRYVSWHNGYHITIGNVKDV